MRRSTLPSTSSTEPLSALPHSAPSRAPTPQCAASCPPATLWRTSFARRAPPGPRSAQPRAPVTVIFERSSSRTGAPKPTFGASHADPADSRPRANSLPTARTTAERRPRTHRPAARSAVLCAAHAGSGGARAGLGRGRAGSASLVSRSSQCRKGLPRRVPETCSGGQRRRQQPEDIAAPAAAGSFVCPSTDGPARVVASAPDGAAPDHAEPRLKSVGLRTPT